MSIAHVLANTDLEPLFVEQLPKLFHTFIAEYAQWSDVDLTVLARFLGDDGGEWSLFVSDLGLEVEPGITGKPLLTVVGEKPQWDQARGAMGELLETYATRLKAPGFRINPALRLTWKRLRGLERLNISVRLSLVAVPGTQQAVTLSIGLNTAKPTQPPEVYLALRYDDLLEAAQGSTSFPKLIAEQRLRVEGNSRAFLELLRALS